MLRHVFTLLAVLTPLFLVACGEEETPLPARDRCDAGGVELYAQGNVSLQPNTSSALSQESSSASGVVERNSLYLELPSLDGATPGLLRLYASDAPEGLINAVVVSIEQGRNTFTVVDTTEAIAGSQNISGLNNYTCALADGQICAQLVLDENEDGLVSDSDGRVFNASGGDVVFEQIRGLSSTFHMTWALTLGGNLLNPEDFADSNALIGCLNTSFEPDGATRWTLGE